MRGQAVHMVLAGVTALSFAGAGWAQLGRGGGSGPRVDTSKTVTVQGDVVSFQAGLGQGMPELVVREANGNETSFVLGPFRYLESQGFVAQAGDRVEINGYVCPSCESGVAVAQVKNLTRGLTVVLRNADGTPVWIAFAGQNPRRHIGAGTVTGQGTGSAQGMGPGHGTGATPHHGRQLCGGDGPDLSRTKSLTGSVVSFTGGPGEGLPTLVLAAAQGDVSIVLSPYRALGYAGYTPAVGAQVEVKAAPVTLGGQEHWVALTIKDLASGLEIVFRDAETGLPVIIGRGGCR
jgi:hypothetical protein